VIPIADFHRLPGNTPHIETSLQPGEFITYVTLPPPPMGVQLYRKVRDRASYAFALVSVAAVVDAESGVIRSGRVAFGGLAHKPWRVPEAEALLRNAPPTSATLAALGNAALQGAHGQGHNDFKIPLVQRVLTTTVMQAARA
jgi:xanthine dehydrogenase YagS FAD-binding subunit